MGMAPWDTIGPEDIHVRYKQDVNSIEYTGGRGQFIVKWGGPGIPSFLYRKTFSAAEQNSRFKNGVIEW